MNRVMYVVFALAGAIAIAHADVIHLKDGSTKEGKVVGKENEVVILEVSAGNLKANLRIPETNIVRIEEKMLPAEEYDQRISQIKPDDAEGYYQLGLWAEQHGLPDEAKTAFDKALGIGDGHLGAAEKLGRVNVEGEWRTRENALKHVEGMYKDSKYQEVYEILQPLKDIPNDAVPSDIGSDAFALLAKTCERLSKWNEAIEAWRRCSQIRGGKTDPSVALARMKVLEDHPDGQFSCGKADVPASLVKLDPSVKPMVDEGGVKSLSDESVMNLAMKAKAMEFVDEAAKYADRVVDRSEASIKAWEMAVRKALAADKMLTGLERDLRVTVIKKGIGFGQEKLREVSAELDQKTKAGGKLAAGEAKECLDVCQKVLARYEAQLEFLKDFKKELPNEFAEAEKGIAREKKRCQWLEEQIADQEIKEKCTELEISYLDAWNKAKAMDPRTYTYTVNPRDGYFQDSGRKWRQNTGMCLKYAKEARKYLDQMLKQYQSQPELFSAEIDKTKKRIVECDALQKQVFANQDRKGVTVRGVYPW